MMDHMKEFITRLKARNYYTPDIDEISQYSYHLTFIDGTLRRQFNEWHKILAEAEYLGDAVSMYEYFVMKRTARTPVLFKHGMFQKNVLRKVLGDVWAVTPNQLMALDHYYHNGELFSREKNVFKLTNQSVPFKNGAQRPVVTAWSYIGNPYYWDNVQLSFTGQRKVGKDFAWVWDPQTTITS